LGGFEFLLTTGIENVEGIPPFADGVRKMGTRNFRDEVKIKSKNNGKGKTVTR